MKLTKRYLITINLVVVLLMCGCASPGLRTSERMKHGMIYILPGIEGRSGYNRNLAQGLVAGGVPAAIDIYDWSTGTGLLGWYIHLASNARHRYHAAKLAKHIQVYKAAYPECPVHLIGHSAGAGVAVMTLEALPDTVQVDSAILLAAAVCPDRNLGRALRRVKNGVYNFYSRRDVGFLGLGTTIFGTVDRRHSTAAGAIGFAQPRDATVEDLELYQSKLVQYPYTPQMAASGHPGSHTGWTNPDFVQRWLAPLIMGNPPAGTEGKLGRVDHRSTDRNAARSPAAYPPPAGRTGR